MAVDRIAQLLRQATSPQEPNLQDFSSALAIGTSALGEGGGVPDFLQAMQAGPAARQKQAATGLEAVSTVFDMLQSQAQAGDERASKMMDRLREDTGGDMEKLAAAANDPEVMKAPTQAEYLNIMQSKGYFGKPTPEPTSAMKEAQSLYPGDKKKQDEYILQKSLKPGTEVNITQEAEESYLKKANEKLATDNFEVVKQVREKAEGARGFNYELRQLDTLLESGIPTGAREEALLPLKKWAQDTLEIGNAEELAGQELFKQIGNRLALKMRNPDSGLGLTGATSDRDVKFLLDGNPNLSNSPAGNRIIIKMGLRQNEYAERLEQFISEKMSENNGLPPKNLSKLITDWRNINPIFTQAEADELKAAVAKVPATGKGEENKPLVFNPETGGFE